VKATNRAQGPSPLPAAKFFLFFCLPGAQLHYIGRWERRAMRGEIHGGWCGLHGKRSRQAVPTWLRPALTFMQRAVLSVAGQPLDASKYYIILVWCPE